MKWTKEQDQILFDYGHKGAEYCARLIALTYNITRSQEATRKHANRIGALMIRYETCPQCGAIVRKLNRNSGLCEKCNLNYLADRTRKKIASGLNEATREEVAARRKYDKERQAYSREKRRYVDFVDMSLKMSITRSEAQKSFA